MNIQWMKIIHHTQPNIVTFYLSFVVTVYSKGFNWIHSCMSMLTFAHTHSHYLLFLLSPTGLFSLSLVHTGLFSPPKQLFFIHVTQILHVRKKFGTLHFYCRLFYLSQLPSFWLNNTLFCVCNLLMSVSAGSETWLVSNTTVNMSVVSQAILTHIWGGSYWITCYLHASF